MINADSIKSMVCRTLVDNFTGHTVYKNKVKQRVKLPCFFISQMDVTTERVSKGKFKKNLIINIRYECENQTNSKNDAMSFEIMDLFDMTSYEEETYIPKKIIQKDSDGIMQLLIYYEIYLVKERVKEPLLNNLQIKGGLKDGRRNI